MILNRPLNAAEQKRSQHNYLLFTFVNGFSYMCLGETVLILFAVRLNCSDTVVAILGGMIYFGFLLLPMGKWMTARAGAVRSQSDFWVMRNIAALIVAAAAPVSFWLGRTAAAAFLLAGSFLFYGFRAAGVVMSRTLVGEICPKTNQGSFLAREWTFFYSSGVIALLLISGILKFHASAWSCFGIILVGAVCGVTSAGIFRKIDETGDIRTSAQCPISQSIRTVFHNKVVIRQLLANMVCNLCVILLIPISMLSLKRGYGVSDTSALLYSLVQFGGSIAVSQLVSRIADRFTARQLILGSFAGFMLIALFWIVTPMTFFWFLLILPFVFCATANILTTVGFAKYFLATIPPDQQVASSIFISVATGVGAGLLGMFASSTLLKLAAYCCQGESGLPSYRLYFLFVLILMPLLGIFLWRLPKDKGTSIH